MALRGSVIAADTPVPSNMTDQNGILRLRPAAEYDDIPLDSLRLWCHLSARYGLPTAELVAWLREFIGDRKAIEIGSGAGDLAYHLGIPATDNRQQEWPDVAAHYRATRQPTISYPDWVRKYDAIDAVLALKPQIVIGSWVTHWINPNRPPPPGGGNMYGVKEHALLALGVTYVVIGNLAVHQHKPILGMPHEEYRLPFLRSRAANRDLERVWVWRGRR